MWSIVETDGLIIAAAVNLHSEFGDHWLVLFALSFLRTSYNEWSFLYLNQLLFMPPVVYRQRLQQGTEYLKTGDYLKDSLSRSGDVENIDPGV